MRPPPLLVIVRVEPLSGPLWSYTVTATARYLPNLDSDPLSRIVPLWWTKFLFLYSLHCESQGRALYYWIIVNAVKTRWAVNVCQIVSNVTLGFNGMGQEGKKGQVLRLVKTGCFYLSLLDTQ